MLSVRALAHELGRRLERAPVIAGREAPDALISDTTLMRDQLGVPHIPIGTLLDWTALWVRRGMPLLGRATSFEVRDGLF